MTTTDVDRFHEKARIFELLRKRGAVKAVLEFSGGNDEGGVDGITLVFPGDEPDKDLAVEWLGGGKPKNENQELSVLLQIPVDSTYGSWAGDFSAYGTLTYDVATEKVTMENFESSGYDHSSEDW